ncbi:septal ring lytic transglycosylase RlpA family protein, partial [Candidatus Peregrinibacteria bacterium]|nr:septal ring lytic transglycosylase RlpA family protein [Candidatus Peregrinibacteria bacterium]
ADHSFHPEQKVNRAEALKIILLGTRIPVPEIKEQEVFPDVAYDAWYGKYAAKAKRMEVVSGDASTGMFRPGDTVNLAETLKILIKARGENPGTPDGNPYADVPKDAWFAPYFAFAAEMSLLDEDENDDVSPALPVTRGMLAELIYRLLTRPEGYQTGQASYYAGRFHGETTAAGEIYDASQFTAAHRTHPFGTWLKVTNAENGKSVKVRVNDRGPYVEGRIIDLSKAAFESIASLSRGVINVTLETTDPPESTETPDSGSSLSADLLDATDPGSCAEKNFLRYYPKTSFENITLSRELPNAVAVGEVLSLSGTVPAGTASVNAFLVDESKKQVSFPAAVENGKFSVSIHFPKTGKINLGVIPGESGQSLMQEITVLPLSCLTETTGANLAAPAGLSLSLSSGDTLLAWEKGDYALFDVAFTQGTLKKRYFVYSVEEFIPRYADLSVFKEGNVKVAVRGAKMTSKSLLEPDKIEWSTPANKDFQAVTHHEYTVDLEQVETVKLPEKIKDKNRIEALIRPKVTLNAKAALILPDGQVQEIRMESAAREPVKNVNDVLVFPPSGEELSLAFTPTETKTHFLEINNAEGLAAINIPLYAENTFPLIPNMAELSERIPVTLGTDLGKLRSQMLTLVNKDRQEQKLSAAALDNALNRLAQSRADDMAKNDYFSHWNKEGLSANDLRKNFAISQTVAENIAKDVNIELAEYSLMRSATHRQNILTKNWTKAGFGMAKTEDGSYVFVQIFSEDPLDLSDPTASRQQILSAINAKRAAALTLADNLDSLAQDWSDLMVSQDCFDFTAPDGGTLVENIRDSGVNASLGTYIVGNTSFTDALEQIAANAQIQQPTWKKIGIGVKQDSFGVIKITLIYTE